MALNFQVPNSPENPWDAKKWHPVTEALIWSTMTIGINQITEKTIDEFTERLRLVEHVRGPYFKGVYMTRQDVEAHMGLWTNASSTTKTQFNKSLVNIAKDNMKRPEKSAIEVMNPC